jgi:hypothetical protein
MTPGQRITRIIAILSDDQLSAVQKCIYCGLTVTADEQGVARATTGQMQVWASTGRKATVVTATDRMFSDIDCIRRISGARQAGVFELVKERIKATLREVGGTEKPYQSHTEKGDQSGTLSVPVAGTHSVPPLVLTAHQTGTLSAPTGTPSVPARARKYIKTNNKTTTLGEEDGVQGKGENLAPTDDPATWRKSSSIPKQLCLRALNDYNALALRLGLPQAITLSPDRERFLRARLFDYRQHGGYAAWQTALANIEKSLFLRGMTKENFRADFDFMVRPSRFGKLVSGGYGNGAAHAPANPSTISNPVPTQDFEDAWARRQAQMEDQ